MVNLSRPGRYAVAVAVILASVGLRLSLNPVWDGRLPYLTLFPAIMLGGWLGGLETGLLTTAGAAAAAAYFWLGPTGGAGAAAKSEWLGLLVFVVVGVFISMLNEAWRRGTRRLIASEQSLNVTLGSIGDAVIVTDQDGRVTRLNAVAEGLTGWTQSEAIGKPLQQVFVAVNQLPNQTVLLSRDGRSIPIDDSVAPIKEEDGQAVGAIRVFRDVSDRRRLESEREEQHRVARELAAIVESSDDAIVSKDLESTIKSWNRGAERMFGYTAEEVVGRSIRIIIPEERWNEEDEVLRQLRRGEKVDHFETVRRRKDGTELFVSLTISPIHAADGRVIGASKIARDISDRKMAEQGRAEMLAREQRARADVERASRLKDDFLAVLSHELRTPLNAVIGYSHLLCSGELPPERARQAVQAIQRNAHAQARLVESLLDLSRVMAGKLELNYEAFDLDAVLEEAAEALRPEAARKGISFDMEPAAGIGLVGDPARLQQVFWNLFSNAIKFTPGPGRITVRVSQNSESVRIRVADEGQGISPEFLPHVFDRFRQGASKTGRAPAGLGLGLALVREMVEAHRGTVVAESAGEGCGSAFTVTLPLEETPSVPAGPAGASPGGASAPLSNLEILIVEDERDAREFLALLLTGRGANVRTAASVDEALDAMARNPPALLLADIAMPEEDGYSLIRRWRRHEREQRSARVRAIAVTAHASPDDRERALSAGYDLHVAKPLDVEILVDAIGRLTRAADLAS